MKNGRTLTLNDKGILSIALLILALTFATGYLASSKRQKQEVTVFSRENLERIVKLQEMEDETGSGAEIYAYKDENGNLMIGWDYSKSPKW